MATPTTGANLMATVDRPVVVVGAGVAGLVCARALRAAGLPVLVLEAADAVGGRLRTTRHPDGYLLDRGFHLLPAAYPRLWDKVDAEAIGCRSFDPGTLVWTGRRLVPFTNPLAHPAGLLRDLTSPLFGTADLSRLARLAAQAWRAPWETAREAADAMGPLAAIDLLWQEGFSRHFVDRFARPVWGGALMFDPMLEGSAGSLLFSLNMLLAGRAVLPRDGTGAVGAELAAGLPSGTVRLGQRVEAVVVEHGRAVGVRVGGELLAASAVVVATDPPAARRLTGIRALPDDADGVASLTVFLGGERDPHLGPRLAADGTGRLTVNHVAPLSVVQPAYAPPARHLLAAVVVGDRLADADDATLARRARADVARMVGHDEADWTILRAIRVPFSRFRQPPAFGATLPGNATDTDGLFLAGEATVDSSVNGAAASGETAARLAVRRLTGGER